YIRATLGTPFAQGLYGAVSMASAGAALAIVPLWPGWRAPFATAAIVAAAGLAVVTPAPRDGARPVPAVRPSSVFDPRLVPLGVMHAASFGLSVVLGNWVGTLLERSGGQSSHVAGVVGGLVLFLGVLSRPLGGRLVTRPAVIRASFVLGGAGIAALAVARPLPLAIAGAAIVGLT